MRRGVRTLVVWVAAAALLGAWWSLRGGERLAESGGAARRPLLDGARAIDVDAIDSIRLARRDAPPLEFVRENGQWRQTAPFALDLDPWSARQMAVEAAALARVREVAPNDVDPARLGLAPPVATLTLAGGGKTRTIELGKRGVAGRAFARVDGDPATYVVEGDLYERAVETDAREWRSRSLFPDALGRPMTLRWTLGDGTIDLARAGDRWAIAAPVKTRADTGRVDDLLAALVRARGDGFLADQPKDLAAFGLAAPAARLSVTYEGEHGPSTRTLLVGTPLGVGTPDRYALIEGSSTVIRLSAATQAMLFPRLAELVEPTGSGVRAADVKRIEVRPKQGDAFELVRDLDRWTASRIASGKPGPSVPCPPGLPEKLLNELCGTRTPEMSFGPFPAELEAAQVIFFGFDLRPLDAVRIAKDDKTGRWGFENGDGVLRIAPATVALPLSADDFGAPR
ncbi:MAG: DUF4340 domain-containing protein [Phycisphaerales bacterium]